MTFIYPPIIALATLLATVLLLPVLMALARHVGIVDHPGALKIHSHPTPLIGGAAILAGFGTAINLAVGTSEIPVQLQVLLVGMSGIWLLGLLDDRFRLSPWIRLSGQTIAAAWLIYFGFTLVPTAPIWLTMPLTLLFIVGLTNAMNLLDGMDGLATGVTLISTIGLTIAAWFLGNLMAFLLCGFFACALVGILLFNWHPARVFLGSNGSLLIGYFLAAIIVKEADKWLVFGGLCCIIALPLIDTTTVIVSRFMAGTPLFTGDRSHLYDRLSAHGYTTRQVVGICYALAVLHVGLGLSLVWFALTH